MAEEQKSDAINPSEQSTDPQEQPQIQESEIAPQTEAAPDFPETDEGRIALVCDAMAKYSGWAEVDRSSITIKTNNGIGGAATYCIQAPESCSPNQVGLHARTQDSQKIPRLLAGLNAFASANLAPDLLEVGSNYWIDSWCGVGDFSGQGVEMWNRCGKLLATIHKIPTQWFDDLKAKYIEQEPVAAQFPAGSLAWFHLQRESWQQLPKMSDESKLAYASAVTTEHPIGGRIVTAHGDFHPGNIIDLGEEHDDAGIYRYKIADFEFTCVTHAIHDISYGVCCSFMPDRVKAFLAGYLEEATAREATDEEIRELHLEAELYKLALWHSGGVLCPWLQAEDTQESILELVVAVKKFIKYVRESEEAQNELLEKGLESFKNIEGNPLYTYGQEKMSKFIEGLTTEAEEAASIFERRLQERQEEDKQVENLIERATWKQPSGSQHPMLIGSASELGLVNQSFTVMCWVKNERPSSGEAWYKDRNAIFVGDVNPQSHGKEWEDYKSKIFHCELRFENRYLFGFGWNETSSTRMCRLGKWDHVAFVFDLEGDGKSIIVNGENPGKRQGEGCKPYEGDENIWLGSSQNQGYGDWVGKLDNAMVFKEALTPEQIFQIAAYSRPNENEEAK